MKITSKDITMKKKDFVNEHKKLIKLLNLLDNEKKEQLKELKKVVNKKKKK